MQGDPGMKQIVYLLDTNNVSGSLGGNSVKKIIEYENKNMQNLSKSDDVDQKYFWYLVKKGKGRLKRLQPVQTDNGTLLTEVNEIRKEWNYYYRGLYADDTSQKWDSEFKNKIQSEIDDRCKLIPKDETMNDGPITLEETKCMLQKMKNRKAPGWDYVTVESLKHSSDFCLQLLTWMLNEIVKKEPFPKISRNDWLYRFQKDIRTKQLKTIAGALLWYRLCIKFLRKLCQIEKTFGSQRSRWTARWPPRQILLSTHLYDILGSCLLEQRKGCYCICHIYRYMKGVWHRVGEWVTKLE